MEGQAVYMSKYKIRSSIHHHHRRRRRRQQEETKDR